MKYKYKYQDFDLEYIIHPTEKELSYLHDQYDIMKKVNQNNIKVDYSIFKKDISKEYLNLFFTKSLFCIIKRKHSPIGFFYNYIFNPEEKHVHIGLIMINDNRDKHLAHLVEKIGNTIIYKYYGKFTITTITTVPKVVEYIHETFSNVQPSMNTRITNQEYKKIAKSLINTYVNNHIVSKDKVSINYRNFMIELSDKKEIGFEDDFYELPKAEKNKYNLYCLINIDYNKGKDMILVGEYLYKNLIKDKLFLLRKKVKRINNEYL